MTAGTMAGAPFGKQEHWAGIDRDQCLRQVRRLQARIVKAVGDGRWNKVKVLQWLLTHSFAGKALAVKRVTENNELAGYNRLWKRGFEVLELNAGKLARLVLRGGRAGNGMSLPDFEDI